MRPKVWSILVSQLCSHAVKLCRGCLHLLLAMLQPFLQLSLVSLALLLQMLAFLQNRDYVLSTSEGKQLKDCKEWYQERFCISIDRSQRRLCVTRQVTLLTASRSRVMSATASFKLAKSTQHCNTAQHTTSSACTTKVPAERHVLIIHVHT